VVIQAGKIACKVTVMSGKHFPSIVCLITLVGASCGLAAEPVLDLRTPVPTALGAPLSVFNVDDRPAWLQRMDAAVRHGVTFVCLRHGSQANLVLGAHPNGYVGVFTTPGGDGRTKRSSC
jgi:hypothetical protein